MPEPFEQSDLFPAPDDLTPGTISDEALSNLETVGVAEFDRVYSITDYTPEMVAYGMRLREDLDRIKAELSSRKASAEVKAAAAKARAERQMAELKEAVHGPVEGTPEAAVNETRMTADREDAIAAAAARGATAALVQVLGDRRNGGDMVKAGERAVASLGATAAVAPKIRTSNPKLAITASANGMEIPSIEALATAFIDKAQSIPVSQAGKEAARHSVARIRNDVQHTVDDRMNPARIEEIWRDMTKGENQKALVAGGGWCAPSQIMYEFFNIADMDGAIDLPTVGVTRGGIRYPVSPAIGDVFFQNAGSNPASGFGGFAFTFGNATDPWLWTETDDILTVTGSINKPTLRVPCPTFNETRLEAYGLTVTAGNLTDNAYPESTQNFIRLLRMAYAHAINGRLISLMDTAAGGTNTIGAVTTDGPSTRVLNSIALAAADYRARFAMATTAVVEVVIPYWVKEVVRADLALRTSLDTSLLAVTDAQIDSFFNPRNVRVQWVNDYQVRGGSQLGNSAVQLVWPATVNFLVYAAGTFLHGTGLTLDLGVVRDSILNAENDFTAAWAEEAHLIALVGHAARKYACAFNVTGSTGGALTAATPHV